MMKQGVTLFIVLMVVGAGVVGFTVGGKTDWTIEPNPRDSLKLERYMELVEEEMSWENDTDITEEERERFEHLGNGISVVEGEYFRSPNNLFTVFSIECQSCGPIRCTPFWKAYLEMNSTGKVFGDLSFMYVSDIIKMPDGKYLVLQAGHDRPSPCVVDGVLKATLFSFTDDTLVFYPFYYNHPVLGEGTYKYYTDSSLVISQEYFIPNEMHLTYDSLTMLLNYRCSTNLGREYGCGMDSAYMFEGYFEYINGKFIHKQETRKYLGSEADYEEEE